MVIRNHTELARSATHSDANISVMLRLFITKMNQIIGKVNELGGDISEITSEEVGAVFSEYARLCERPDRASLNRHWCFGTSMDDLPPPPEPEALEVGEDPYDATVFGGDYEEKRQEDDEYQEGDAVPEVPEDSQQASESGDR